MPSTAQKQKPTKQTVWSKTNSTTVMKNLVRTSISQICYLRNMFPHDCFTTKKYVDDLFIQALTPAQEVAGSQPSIRNEEAWMLTRWLEEGVFVALEKQYLKSMTFSVYSGTIESRTFEESYIYEVTYPEAGKVGLA